MVEELARTRLATGAGDLWKIGTRARFLDAVGDGTLPDEAFRRWLSQDYLFVKDFARFVALVIAKAPRPAQGLLVGGLAALDAELDWFEEHQRARSLDLDADPHPVCRRYADFLVASAYTEPFPVLLAIFFGVEVAYTVAWGRLEPRGPYGEFIDRWTNPGFQEYVRSLGELADRYTHPDQQSRFDEVMRHERDFWRMTWEG